MTLYLLKMSPMKNRINNLEDIRREKQKLLLQIGKHEYALGLNFRQIRSKLTFVSFTAYMFDLVREHVKARIPSVLSGVVSAFWRVFFKKKR
jgi:hypothetical protein